MATAINLLPDVRQEKVKAKRRRQTTAALATIISGTALGLVVVMFLITQGQRLRIGQLQNDINTRQAQILADKDLVKIVTAQQHLTSIPNLYKQRIILTKFYAALGTVSPKDYSLQSISIDPNNVIKFTGIANNYYTATKFAKALEASNVTVGPGASTSNQPYFTNIGLDAVTTGDKGQVNFSLSATMSQEVTRGTN